MILFLTLLPVSLIMVICKVFFWNLEPAYFKSAFGVLDVFLLMTFFVLGFIYILRDQFNNRIVKNKKIFSIKNIATLLLLFVSLLGVFKTYKINYSKKSVHWDAIALYDARAKFLEQGMRFSDMPQLSKYDNLNKYYYLLYPPYTSIGHYLWRITSFTSNVPVSVYYSVFLTALVAIVYLTSVESLGKLGAALVTILVTWNSSIINIAIKEYTNLPFTLHIVSGVFLIYLYMRKRSLGYFLLGTFLIGTSIWIRMLEPIWLAVALALTVSLFDKKKKYWNLTPALGLIIFSLAQFLSWGYFTKTISDNPGYLNVTYTSIFEPFIALFTGAPFVILPTVFLKWGLILLIHFISFFVLLFRIKQVWKNKAVLFLGLVNFFSFALYIFQIYLLSFQFDWWSIIASSLDRSSTFMIPISAYILVWSLMN